MARRCERRLPSGRRDLLDGVHGALADRVGYSHNTGGCDSDDIGTGADDESASSATGHAEAQGWGYPLRRETARSSEDTWRLSRWAPLDANGARIRANPSVLLLGLLELFFIRHQRRASSAAVVVGVLLRGAVQATEAVRAARRASHTIEAVFGCTACTCGMIHDVTACVVSCVCRVRVRACGRIHSPPLL